MSIVDSIVFYIGIPTYLRFLGLKYYLFFEIRQESLGVGGGEIRSPGLT